MTHDGEDAAKADHDLAEGALGRQAGKHREHADADHIDTTTAAADNREQADRDHVETLAVVADSAGKLDELLASSNRLVAAVRARVARDDRDRFRFIVSLAVAFATIILIGLVAVSQLRDHSARDARDRANAAEQRAAITATQKQLTDCVTPKGKCYLAEEQRRKAAAAEGERLRGEAVKAIAERNAAAAAAAAACAQTNFGFPAIKKCVDKALGG